MASNTREKSIKHSENRDIRPKAHVKHVRISSRKVGPVIDLIRGKSVDEAKAILKFTHKASPIVLKLLDSAVANAVNNGYGCKSPYIAEVYANEGPTMKRSYHAAPGSPILKRTSHISIVLTVNRRNFNGSES